MTGRASDRAFLYVGAVPGILAAGVAYMYVVGTARTYGQAVSADLDFVQVMRSVPLEQIVAQGAGTAVSAVLLVTMTSFGLAFFKPDSPDPPSHKLPTKRRLWIYGAVVVAGIAVFFPPAEAATLLLVVAVSIAVWIQMNYRWDPMRYIPRYLIMLVAVQATFILGKALLQPEPLPSLTLETASGEVIEADLVVATGTSWYFVEPNSRNDPKEIVALDATEVVDAQIENRERDEDDSLFQVIF